MFIFLKTALIETEQELKTECHQWQRAKSCHLEELEQCRRALLPQMELQQKENKTFTADRLQWEQEEASLQEEMEESRLESGSPWIDINELLNDGGRQRHGEKNDKREEDGEREKETD